MTVYNKKPIISVIVPVYNTGKYLSKCINSIINQKIKNIEIILINDGSTDNSFNILLNYFIKFPNIIKIFNIKHAGISKARNIGLKYAQGLYIGFVDSDDWIEQDMYYNMLRNIVMYNSDISICNIIKEDEYGNIISKIIESNHETDSINVINMKTDFSIFGNLSLFACNKLFKRKLFKNIIFFDIIFEDIATIGSILLSVKKIVIINNYYYHYIKRKNSITYNCNKNCLDIYKSIDIVKKNFI